MGRERELPPERYVTGAGGGEQGLSREELEEHELDPLPERHAMSLVALNPNAAIGAERTEGVPAADPAPVGGRVSIMPIEEEQI